MAKPPRTAQSLDCVLEEITWVLPCSFVVLLFLAYGEPYLLGVGKGAFLRSWRQAPKKTPVEIIVENTMLYFLYFCDVWDVLHNSTVFPQFIGKVPVICFIYTS